MTKEKTRHSFMTEDEQASMGTLPRTHENCLEKTGKSRPGKTAQDHATGAWQPKWKRLHGAKPT